MSTTVAYTDSLPMDIEPTDDTYCSRPRTLEWCRWLGVSSSADTLDAEQRPTTIAEK